MQRKEELDHMESDHDVGGTPVTVMICVKDEKSGRWGKLVNSVTSLYRRLFPAHCALWVQGNTVTGGLSAIIEMSQRTCVGALYLNAKVTY